jgi:glucosamine--fructose-6-phosphate aminotransferase (isomerizing)
MTSQSTPLPGALTRAEIFSQPDVWTRSLAYFHQEAAGIREFLARGGYESLLFTGCGSTYYLSIAAAAVFQAQTGMAAKGLPASEIWLDPAVAYAPKQRHLLAAVSRSGATTETIRAIDAFRQRGHGGILTLSCYPQAAMAGKGDLNLLFTAAQEESVAQTRAFSTLYVATVALAFLAAKNNALLEQMDGLARAGESLLARYAGLAAELGRDPRYERFYFLGSGARYGLACEVSLKMKEMSLSHSEPFHFMEFRHGPMSMVNEQSLLIGMVSDARREQEMKVLSEMQKRGATVVALAEKDADVTLASGVAEEARGALYLPFLQLMAFEHSLSKGLNPDRPNNLTAVVELA